MATIHIHPTAASPRRIAALQQRTGLVAVVSGAGARLIDPQRWAQRHLKSATTSRRPAPAGWDGPGAA